MLHFFKPSVIKVSFALLCFGLTLLFVTPIFAMLKVVPCRLVESGWSMCAINPAKQPGTMYLGSIVMDNIYLIIYLVSIVLVIPYTMSCFLFWLYERFFKKLMNSLV
jgi:hypothetical protein